VEIHAARQRAAAQPVAAESAPDDGERAVLRALLSAYPGMVDIEELRTRLPGLAVDFSVVRLIDDGLVSRLGDGLTATRAAVRGAELAG
jgi:hypothetical protein